MLWCGLSHLQGMSLVHDGLMPRVTEDEIRRLVEAFYAKVPLDPVIGPIFNEQVEDWPAHLALLKEFWAAVLLGTGNFRWNPLATHLKMTLIPEHFEGRLAKDREIQCRPRRGRVPEHHLMGEGRLPTPGTSGDDVE